MKIDAVRYEWKLEDARIAFGGTKSQALDQNRLTTRTELIPSIPKELLRI